MMRYVVCVKPPDDHPGMVRVYGPWRSKAEATAFSEAIRAPVMKAMDIGDESPGFAYVMELEKPHRTNAKRWAMRGE